MLVASASRSTRRPGSARWARRLATVVGLAAATAASGASATTPDRDDPQAVVDSAIAGFEQRMTDRGFERRDDELFGDDELEGDAPVADPITSVPAASSSPASTAPVETAPADTAPADTAPVSLPGELAGCDPEVAAYIEDFDDLDSLPGTIAEAQSAGFAPPGSEAGSVLDGTFEYSATVAIVGEAGIVEVDDLFDNLRSEAFADCMKQVLLYEFGAEGTEATAEVVTGDAGLGDNSATMNLSASASEDGIEFELTAEAVYVRFDDAVVVVIELALFAPDDDPELDLVAEAAAIGDDLAR